MSVQAEASDVFSEFIHCNNLLSITVRSISCSKMPRNWSPSWRKLRRNVKNCVVPNRYLSTYVLFRLEADNEVGFIFVGCGARIVDNSRAASCRIENIESFSTRRCISQGEPRTQIGRSSNRGK